MKCGLELDLLLSQPRPICAKCGGRAQTLLDDPGKVVAAFRRGDVVFYLHTECWEEILWEWWSDHAVKN